MTPQAKRQVEQQIADGVQSLPLDQVLMLLRLVRYLQEHPRDETWGWALCLDVEDGGNGKC